jgi:cyclophilin family peptidyl-prolyl cis-trans isomerase
MADSKITTSTVSAAPLGTYASMADSKGPPSFQFGVTSTLGSNTTTSSSSKPVFSIPASEQDTNQKTPASPANATLPPRDRLIAFYKKHNPEKLDKVEETLANFLGKEDELFRKLEEKYVKGKEGVFPPGGEGPICFIDFVIGDGAKKGRVVVKLYHDKVPLASENFRCLCTGEKGMGRSMKPLCYRFSKVHRIVPKFCVQLGDFTRGNGTGGESIYPPNSEHGDVWGKFKDELFMQHSRKGLLSMANNGKNGNQSQFFFTLQATPSLNGKHVVFGEVVEGMKIIELIASIPTDAKQYPQESVMVENCGELRDGKEIQGKVGSASSSSKHKNKRSAGWQ